MDLCEVRPPRRTSRTGRGKSDDIDALAAARTVLGEHVEGLLARVTPYKSMRYRCGSCSRKSPRYDRGAGPRRWRTLDRGTTETYLVAETPHVNCPEHGVTVAAVPWAHHQAGRTPSSTSRPPGWPPSAPSPR